MSANQTVVPRTAFKKGEKRPGQGRPKGVLNKNNQQIRDIIVQTLDNLGGTEYLQEVARSHPAAFMALIGKTMPLQVTGENGGEIAFSVIERRIVKPSN
jgi:hypothetical protein